MDSPGISPRSQDVVDSDEPESPPAQIQVPAVLFLPLPDGDEKKPTLSFSPSDPRLEAFLELSSESTTPSSQAIGDFASPSPSDSPQPISTYGLGSYRTGPLDLMGIDPINLLSLLRYAEDVQSGRVVPEHGTFGRCGRRLNPLTRICECGGIVRREQPSRRSPQLSASSYASSKGYDYCVFCKNNNRPPHIYKNHLLRDEENMISCPYLQAYVCPYCGATGKLAHTKKYCPLNKAPEALQAQRAAANSRPRVRTSPVDYQENGAFSGGASEFGRPFQRQQSQNGGFMRSAGTRGFDSNSFSNPQRRSSRSLSVADEDFVVDVNRPLHRNGQASYSATSTSFSSVVQRASYDIL